MALDANIQSRIVSLTDAHWSEHVHDAGFAELTEGKETGQRIAAYVDERTCDLLKVNLDTRYEGDSKGRTRERSMGDIWVRSQGIYNPINVKAGLQNMRSRPNVVAMQKLLDYILNRWIDSYYLLIVKFDLSAGMSHKTYFIDILDWIDFIRYDAGPGQIMLREQDLYDELDAGRVPDSRNIFEKAEALFELFERQVQTLIANRRERLNRQRALSREFQRTDFTVDQSQVKFVP